MRSTGSSPTGYDERPVAPLSAESAGHVARRILDGFDRHFRIFRDITRQARGFFIAGHWRQARQTALDRISFYDQRVRETVTVLGQRYSQANFDQAFWQDVKFRYMGLLYDHRQPELAETFYNSVFVGLFRRRFYNNEYLFVRPSLSTERLDSDAPVFRSYYPKAQGWRRTLRRILLDADLGLAFEDVERDIRTIARGMRDIPRQPDELPRHFQLQILAPLFYRNRSAYIVGRAVIGGGKHPFILQLRRNDAGRAFVRRLVHTAADTANRFSSARAYFLVDSEIPSAVVRFLLTLLPDKMAADIYTQIGFHKQGKAEFYRDFLDHIRCSTDLFECAPGSPGLVMLVFTLPSYPYVFKVIRDRFKPPKNTTRQSVIDRYHLVKMHDRVGRMSDAWEFSNAAFPLDRFGDQLLRELRAEVPSQLSIEDGQVVIKHLFIERRLEPLNLYLERVSGERLQHALTDYGEAVREIAAAGLFPGDLLLKNFGMTRHGRVIFYDYDEVVPICDCRFRDIPQARFPEDEMASSPWYSVGANDVFPEEFATFLFPDPARRRLFERLHGRLLKAVYWRSLQHCVSNGEFPD